MIYRITGSKDATIYQRNTDPDRTEQNTGVDSMLELSQEQHSAGTGSGVFNSRILIQFENFDTESLDINVDPDYYLHLYETDESRNLPSTVYLKIHPLLASWHMGLGNFDDYPITKDKASWVYKSDSLWTNPGGDYNTDYVVLDRAEYNSKDINKDVTSIVEKWNDETINNYGFIIKRIDSEEISTASLGTLKYFSTETNTIYQPRLEIKWDDSSWTTGSLTALDISDNIIIGPSSLQGKYNNDSKVKIRVIGREKYPTKTYVTESVDTITNYYLPSGSSYYSIIDAHTDEVVIPFDDDYTKLSCDSTSNYFNLWMDQFEPKRYYKLNFKVVNDGVEKYFKSTQVFEVTK